MRDKWEDDNHTREQDLEASNELLRNLATNPKYRPPRQARAWFINLGKDIDSIQWYLDRLEMYRNSPRVLAFYQEVFGAFDRNHPNPDDPIRQKVSTCLEVLKRQR